MQQEAMSRDHGWPAVALQYLSLYRSLMGRQA
jgi:glycogen synthase